MKRLMMLLALPFIFVTKDTLGMFSNGIVRAGTKMASMPIITNRVHNATQVFKKSTTENHTNTKKITQYIKHELKANNSNKPTQKKAANRTQNGKITHSSLEKVIKAFGKSNIKIKEIKSKNIVQENVNSEEPKAGIVELENNHTDNNDIEITKEQETTFVHQNPVDKTYEQQVNRMVPVEHNNKIVRKPILDSVGKRAKQTGERPADIRENINRSILAAANEEYPNYVYEKFQDNDQAMVVRNQNNQIMQDEQIQNIEIVFDLANKALNNKLTRQESKMVAEMQKNYEVVCIKTDSLYDIIAKEELQTGSMIHNTETKTIYLVLNSNQTVVLTPHNGLTYPETSNEQLTLPIPEEEKIEADIIASPEVLVNSSSKLVKNEAQKRTYSIDPHKGSVVQLDAINEIRDKALKIISRSTLIKNPNTLTKHAALDQKINVAHGSVIEVVTEANAVKEIREKALYKKFLEPKINRATGQATEYTTLEDTEKQHIPDGQLQANTTTLNEEEMQSKQIVENKLLKNPKVVSTSSLITQTQPPLVASSLDPITPPIQTAQAIFDEPTKEFTSTSTLNIAAAPSRIEAALDPVAQNNQLTAQGSVIEAAKQNEEANKLVSQTNASMEKVELVETNPAAKETSKEITEKKDETFKEEKKEELTKENKTEEKDTNAKKDHKKNNPRIKKPTKPSRWSRFKARAKKGFKWLKRAGAAAAAYGLYKLFKNNGDVVTLPTTTTVESANKTPAMQTTNTSLKDGLKRQKIDYFKPLTSYPTPDDQKRRKKHTDAGDDANNQNVNEDNTHQNSNSDNRNKHLPSYAHGMNQQNDQNRTGARGNTDNGYNNDNDTNSNSKPYRMNTNNKNKTPVYGNTNDSQTSPSQSEAGSTKANQSPKSFSSSNGGGNGLMGMGGGAGAGKTSSNGQEVPTENNHQESIFWIIMALAAFIAELIVRKKKKLFF